MLKNSPKQRKSVGQSVGHSYKKEKALTGNSV
jgi:hypothetical protein